ncbi:MAG: metallophosphoesterase family protein [Erythrobacter sp.]|uniref:metallophosphoesterase family protein n=1 Tax=Erythrobacter sp. TaxID=1042 RepID=UPI00261F2A1F|nr:metallophosphoesterase family protein [Erythrobacter sp.]MDJ0979958.1 metallophosphoesterase family protein [Erythrobacter sp.]
MLDALRNIFQSSPKDAARLPSVPQGTRYYVIGDIHGRRDLYETLIEAIETDDAMQGPSNTQVVLLGDLVDRGPDSAGVIERTRQWQGQRAVRVLAGNHEEMFLTAFEKPDILRHFLKHGGRETFLSYGLSREQLMTLTLEELFELIPTIVPKADIEYIQAFEECIAAGDYLFVHAGIDPALPIDQQKRSDLLWIRDRFLTHEGPLEKVVVHGHTIFDRVMDCGNRIGIDTGAFRSGVLTCLVLEGEGRRIIQALERDTGEIEIVHLDHGG